MRAWRSQLEMQMPHYLLSVGLIAKTHFAPQIKVLLIERNIILIATDLMHHGTFSTCICCGGYREWRRTSPVILLPKSFGSRSHLYVSQLCYLSNFSLTVGEARNIYKINKVCSVLSKFKPFQKYLHSLQIYPSQLFKTAVHDNKTPHFNLPEFPKCLSSNFLLLSMWNLSLLSQVYI